MQKKKKVFIYKFANNPNLEKTHRKFKELFGEGYIFDKKYPNATKELTREEIINLFKKDIQEGKFDLFIVDTSYGKGRFMKEEIALAKKLKIPIKEINLNETKPQ